MYQGLGPCLAADAIINKLLLVSHLSPLLSYEARSLASPACHLSRLCHCHGFRKATLATMGALGGLPQGFLPQGDYQRKGVSRLAVETCRKVPQSDMTRATLG